MNSKRTCDHINVIPFYHHSSCASVFFPVSGGAYNRVCGRVTAYQYLSTGAFGRYHDGQVTTIDDLYVDGVSLTHGSPRQHIWTFAAGVSEAQPHFYSICPCDASGEISVPSFVGGDYFCESGVNSGLPSGFHSDDPLWDGKNCTNSSTCCSFNNPPYFTKRLSSATTDDIEVRLCSHYSLYRSPIELLEIYTKLDVVDVEEVEHNVVSGVREELQRTQESLQHSLQHNLLSNIQLNDLAGYDVHLHMCGGTGGWTRIAYLDMTDSNTNCPSSWELDSQGYGHRACDGGGGGCNSTLFPVSGAYNKVCGRIKGYQYGETHAFQASYRRIVTTIDEPYIDGVSLTHGSPRQHIWTFAAGLYEYGTGHYGACPCDAVRTHISIPSFVGEDYFCESGTLISRPNVFYGDDPLWDGKNCLTSTSTCCSFNNPPYFTKRLSNPTTDDIEARLCQRYSNTATPVEFMELYVKLDPKISLLNAIREDHGRTNVYVCGGTGGWRRVAYLDMTDYNTNCPSGWQLTRHSKRTCGKAFSTSHLTCDSVFFPVSGGTYTSVCGRIKGYQYGHTDAFESYHNGRVTTIDEAYVSGVSLTYGTPRQHIWTFAASPSSTSTDDEACPCNSTTHRITPSFVGQNYFCESGRNSGLTDPLYVDDPLWDGDSCAVISTCCPFNNPPYFTKRLSSATTDDLEVRLCRYDSGDDTPIEFMELYIK